MPVDLDLALQEPFHQQLVNASPSELYNHQRHWRGRCELNLVGRSPRVHSMARKDPPEFAENHDGRVIELVVDAAEAVQIGGAEELSFGRRLFQVRLCVDVVGDDAALLVP